jgi:hypothetical protein
MHIEPTADFTWCEICGEKLPYYMHLCPKCRYMLMSLRSNMDKDCPNLTEEEAQAALDAYDTRRSKEC